MLKNRRAGIGIAVLALAASGLAACSAGKTTQTQQKESAVAGVSLDVGDVTLRDVQVEYGETGTYAEGAAAALRVWIANEGEKPVVLEGVESPAADAVILAEEGTETVVEDEETPTEAPTDEESPTDAGEDEATAEETPTDTSTGEAEETEEQVTEIEGEREFEIEIPPGGHIRLDQAVGQFLVLEGLTQPLDMGTSVEVVFAFSGGGEATMSLPIGLPAEPLPREYLEEGEGGH